MRERTSSTVAGEHGGCQRARVDPEGGGIDRAPEPIRRALPHGALFVAAAIRKVRRARQRCSKHHQPAPDQHLRTESDKSCAVVLRSGGVQSSEALTAATTTGCFVPIDVVANTATVLTATVTKACAVLRADSACTYAFCLRLSPRQLSGLAVISMLASSPPTRMTRALRTTKTTSRMMPGTA